MTSFKQFLEEELRDKEFAQEYERVSAEMDFALALARRREQLGMTQQELAEETGIKQPMIARIEHGQMPTAPTLQRLAKALRVNIVFTGDAIALVTIGDMSATYVKRKDIHYTYRQELRQRSSPYKVSEDETVSFSDRGVLR
jgi:transcriptional regulator with XRE-family HTH domain